MKNMMTVFRKEFYRVMSDRRLLFTAVLLPGVAIYVIYSLMGNIIGGQVEEVETHEMIVYTENMSAEFADYLAGSEMNVKYEERDDLTFDEIEAMLLEGDMDLFMSFPSGFDERLVDYEDATELPNVDMFYNPSKQFSSNTYYQFQSQLTAFSQAVGLDRHGLDYYIFTINQADEDYEIFDEQKATGQGLASLLPMLIVMFLFSGAMSIGPDSIAGEKERGTIATLLVTPIKRSDIAIGKVMSLSLVSLMSATSSFIGIMLSLPKLMQGENIDLAIYGVFEFVMLFTILLATVLVIVGLISIVSAYAKTIKEASMLILPFYFGAVILGVSSMFSDDTQSNLFLYLIPLYNTIQMLIGILTFEINTAAYLVTMISSLVYVSIFVYILNRMFQSEKIMFSK
ncbi:MAG: ABC transporter permease [Candidatus Izemoplasmataceae bacterium]